jgi:hypothetical protein
MKKSILLALVVLAFAACQKSGTNPTKITASKQDTIPDTAYFKVQLIKDSTIRNGTNEILVEFNHKFHLSFTTMNSEDVAPPGWNPNFAILGIASDGTMVGWVEYLMRPVSPFTIIYNSHKWTLFTKRLFSEKDSFRYAYLL